MKSRSIISIISTVLVISTFAIDGWRQGEMEVRVSLKNRREAQLLAQLKLDGDIYMGSEGPSGFAILYVIPQDLQSITALGLSFTIQIQDLNEYYKGFWDKKDRYFSYEEIIKKMNDLEKSHPEICKKFVFGSSVQNRELSALKISDKVNDDEAEPEILFDAGIHGNEVGGPQNLILFATDLCTKYNTDQQIKELVDSREIWLYCMVSPDGRVRNSRHNANRIDLNRNWGYMTTMTSKGFSEPETRGIRDCLLKNQFTIQYTYHSGIECILYPWGRISSPSADRKHHEILAQKYYSASSYNRLEIESSYSSYFTTGETLDYSYGALGISSFTMEISFDKSPDNIAEYYDKNDDAMLEMIEYAGYGLTGMVTDANSGTPLGAIVYVDDSYPVYNDPVVGDYHKFLKSGNYTVKVVASGYHPKTVSNVVIRDERVTKQDFALEPNLEESSTWGHRIVFVEQGTGETPHVLGPKDSKIFTPNNKEILIDMLHPIKNNGGKDLKVHVRGSGSYSVSIGEAVDGPWKNIGSGSGTEEFDIVGSGLDDARYVKIKGSCGLDAVEALGALTHTTQVLQSKTMPTVAIQSSNQKVIFTLSENQPTVLEIFSAQGQLIKRKTIDPATRQYVWIPLASGCFLARVNIGNRIGLHKFTVTN